jgi:hypothetical protein
MVGAIRIPLLLKVFFVGLIINGFFILVGACLTIAANFFNAQWSNGQYRTVGWKRVFERQFDYREYFIALAFFPLALEFSLFKNHKVNIGLLFMPFSLLNPYIGFYLGVKVVQRIRRWGRHFKGIRVASPGHEVDESSTDRRREGLLKHLAKDFLEVSKWLNQHEKHPRIE